MGVGEHTNCFAHPLIFGCLNVDVLRVPTVDVVCDVAHLPFQNSVFQDVYCFHVIEHTPNPIEGLKELVRVAHRLVEVEVPHWLGRMAKSEHYKKGDMALWHQASFKCMWFHKALKNFYRSVRVIYNFPRDLRIHVWIYIEETKRRMRQAS